MRMTNVVLCIPAVAVADLVEVIEYPLCLVGVDAADSDARVHDHKFAWPGVWNTCHAHSPADPCKFDQCSRQLRDVLPVKLDDFSGNSQTHSISSKHIRILVNA